MSHLVIVRTDAISAPRDHGDNLATWYKTHWGSVVGYGIESQWWLDKVGMTATPYVEVLPYETDAIRGDNGMYSFNLGFTFEDEMQAAGFRAYVESNA